MPRSPQMVKTSSLATEEGKALSFALKLGACRDTVEVFELASAFCSGIDGHTLLVYQPWDRPAQVVEVGKSFWRERELDKNASAFNFLETGISVGDRNLSRKLAQVLGRPVGQVVKFPLPLGRLFLRPILGAIWIIERSKASKVSKAFSQEELFSWIQAVDLMTHTIESLESLFELKREIFKSEKVFQEIADPLAVITADGQVLLCNRAFMKVSEQFSLSALIESAVSAHFGASQETSEILEFHHVLNPKSGSDQPHRFQVIISSIQMSASLKERRFLLCLRNSDKQAEKIMALVHRQRDEIFASLKSQFVEDLNKPLRALAPVLDRFEKFISGLKEGERKHQLFKDLDLMKRGRERSLLVVQNLNQLFFESPTAAESEIISVLQATAAEILGPSISYEIEIQPPLSKAAGVKVKLSEVLLRQVVRNLILNAKQSFDPKKGDQGPGPYLKVDLWKDGGHIFCRIKDKGRGVPSELIEKIFEPYFTFRKSKGTGLGLSFVKKVLESFGGGIYLDQDFKSSELGASFVFFIPEG